ncbi:MAG: M16 family metallopeptidase [Alphaproteobacteria bacterium]
MSVETHKLSNGATVLIDPIPHVQTISIGYFFNKGARHETKRENGIAHFLEHMAFKGTDNMTARELGQKIAFLGAKANAFTSKDMTAYFMAGAADQATDINGLVYDIAANMACPAQDLEIERGVIIGEIGEYADDAGSVNMDSYTRTAFPSHAFGRTILGPKEHIERFSRADLQGFRKKHYHAGNLVVSVAGNVSPDKILEELEATAGQISEGNKAKLIKPKYAGGHAAITRPTENLDVYLGFNAAAQGRKENLAAQIMSNILGSGFSSRLFQRVRVENGLGYSVSSGAYRTYDAGTHILHANINQGGAAKLVEIFCDEINRIKQEPVTDLEFESAKNGIKVSDLMSNESVGARMRSNVSQLLYKGRTSSSTEFLERLAAVTKDDVMKAAQNSLSGVPTLSSIGPSGLPDYDDVLRRLDI